MGSSRWLKGLAVIGALAMGGSYVAWKGAEAGKAKVREQAERARAIEELNEVPLIVGSKSPGGRALTREEIQQVVDERLLSEVPSATEKNDVLLPGSKSFVPTFRSRKVDEEQPIKVLSGSKSINFILDNPEQKPAEEAVPELFPGSKSGIPIFESGRPEEEKP